MHIELQTIYCITDPIIIDDEETIAAITRYVDAANGQKGESAKGVFCTPYMFTLYYNDGKKMQFYLWSANTYSTSEDVDEEGYHMLYHADLQDMYEYVQSKYPVPKTNE